MGKAKQSRKVQRTLDGKIASQPKSSTKRMNSLDLAMETSPSPSSAFGFISDDGKRKRNQDEWTAALGESSSSAKKVQRTLDGRIASQPKGGEQETRREDASDGEAGAKDVTKKAADKQENHVIDLVGESKQTTLASWLKGK